jgi:asparagine synthase (glutamine-hydrolysing)
MIGGIVGYGAGTLAAAQVCDGMLTALKQRGTDVHGTFISQEVCLMHTGYAKMENAKQPMRTRIGSREYVLVYDGELNNSEDLRKELKKMGYKFSDSSDESVVLYGFMAWGQRVAKKMNGVFSFALWDGDRLFIARDSHGLKPMFYSEGSHGLVFASSIKAILSHPRVKPEAARSPGCGVFKDIKELQPGEQGTYISGQGMKI